ncbi:chaplin family protein [Actinomadura chokoriensis]|uniref:Chaplin family protein n=1 Tax=Actinomadura chokoriensis TaxID=454156 RepID=A0ABV4QXI9_9ACTN
MRTRAKGISRTAVLAAGFAALGVTVLPSTAFADVTNGDGGVLSGNQVDAPISVPVDVSGNGAALLGTGHATSRGGAKVHKRGTDGQRTSGRHGVASGNQVNAPVSLPVNVCGNAVGILGRADAGCVGGAKVNDGGADGQVTDGTGGVIAGNQVNAPISIPVNVCGNAVAIAGNAVAGCEGGSLVKSGGKTGSGQETSGIFGVGAGNQGNIPISVPVDVCGNAGGSGAASCAGGASVRNGGHRTGRQITDGAFGILAGNQANAPISIPVTACGDAAPLAGRAWAFCEGGAHVRSSSGGDQHTSGTGGILAGDQGNTPISIPVDVCGDAAAVAGESAASCKGQTLVGAPHGSGGQSSGGHGSGGYHSYSRTTGTSFPALSKVATDLPATDASTLRKPTATHPNLPPLPRPGRGLPATDGVLAKGTLPKVDAVTKGPLRQVVAAPGSAVGTQVLPGVSGAAGRGDVPVVGEIGPVRKVAAQETAAGQDRDRAGSLWAPAAAGVLGVVAGALALARRVRLGGRR